MNLALRSTPPATIAVGALAACALSAALVLTAHPVEAGAAPQHSAAMAAGNFASFASAASSIPVHGRGNGHGHGMSQYGAQGAAQAGLSSQQIVGFYYPGTTLKTLGASTVRVSISDAGSSTNVAATTPGLSLSGYGRVPSGYDRFRLVADGSGLALGGERPDGAWVRLKSGLGTRADFSGSSGFVRLYLTNGTSTRYRGTIGAVRNGSGLLTINRVSLDGYTMGVVPREMPASWRPAAVGAQAIAARTYGRNAVENHSGSLYDICDTTWCQVYGGMTHYSSGGSVLWEDDPAAVVGNQNQVLQYSGKTIFAQFSASNGGAMLTGGLPYLVNKTDPYDNSGTGDPYLGWSDSVSASGVASYYGLSSVSSIEVTQRNGYGTWGGWVLSATVNGTDWNGTAKHVSTTGTSLASAMGVLTSYFHFDDEPVAPSAPTAAHATPGDSGAAVSWSAPVGTEVSSYRLTWGHNTLTVPGTAHSAYIAPIWQTADQKVWITATNAYGTGPAALVTVRGTPAPDPVVSVSPSRIIDTRGGATVDAAHPYTVDVAGRGTLPKTGATSVQLALTIQHATAGGHLDIFVHGSPAAPAVSVPYHTGQFVTTTVSVPLRPSSTLIFKPSRGSVDILGEQESYTASWGKHVRPVLPSWSKRFDDVGTDGRSTLSFAGAPIVNSDTDAVLLSVRAWAGATSTWLRLWPDDRSLPQVVHVSTSPYGPSANTVLVRLPASHVIHIAAGRSGVGAVVTLLGTTGNGGGNLETVPAAVIADDSVPSRPSRAVGTDVVTQQVAGLGQTPVSGANAVLVQFRVTATGASGKLYAWPTGASRPDASVIGVGPGQSQVATALVAIGTGGTVNLQASTPGLKVSMLSMGYLSTS